MTTHPRETHEVAEDHIRDCLADLVAQRDEARDLAQLFAKQLLRCNVHVAPAHLVTLDQFSKC
jgi:hypothetical protein